MGNEADPIANEIQKPEEEQNGDERRKARSTAIQQVHQVELSRPETLGVFVSEQAQFHSSQEPVIWLSATGNEGDDVQNRDLLETRKKRSELQTQALLQSTWNVNSSVMAAGHKSTTSHPDSVHLETPELSHPWSQSEDFTINTGNQHSNSLPVSEFNLSASECPLERTQLGSNAVPRARLANLRRRVQVLRRQVQDQRNKLQDQDDIKAQADDKYIKQIRTMHVTSKGLSSIDQRKRDELEVLWSLCQTARNKHGILEDDLGKMEDRLETEETKLEQAEAKVYYDQQPGSIHPALDSTGEEWESSSESSSQTSEEGEMTLYDEFLWMIGKKNLLQERVAKSEEEFLQLKEEEERRRPFNISLDSSDQRYLDSFETMIRPLRAELADISAEVDELRKLCHQEGLIPDDPSENGGDLIDESPDYATPDPPHLKNPSTDLPLHGTSLTDPKSTDSNELFISPPDYMTPSEEQDVVSSWLLDILCSSSFETFKAREICGNVAYIDKEIWMELMKKLWYNDDTEV